MGPPQGADRDLVVNHALATLAAEAANLLAGPDADRFAACDPAPCDRFLARTHDRRQWCSTRCRDRVRATRGRTRRHRSRQTVSGCVTWADTVRDCRAATATEEPHTTTRDMSMVPEDLAVWRRRQDAGEPNPWSDGVRLLAEDERPSVLDTSYLTAEDLANLDIAANVLAIGETAALITWVAEDEDEGQAFGYWRGPAGLPLGAAPIVSLDNEGQFQLLRGATLSEALSDEYGQWTDDGYPGLVAKCRSHGVPISADDPAELREPAVSPTPAEHHVARCRELLAASSARGSAG